MGKYKLTWRDLSWNDFKVYLFAMFKAFTPKGKITNLDEIETFIYIDMVLSALKNLIVFFQRSRGSGGGPEQTQCRTRATAARRSQTVAGRIDGSKSARRGGGATDGGGTGRIDGQVRGAQERAVLYQKVYGAVKNIF